MAGATRTCCPVVVMAAAEVAIGIQIIVDNDVARIRRRISVATCVFDAEWCSRNADAAARARGRPCPCPR